MSRVQNGSSGGYVLALLAALNLLHYATRNVVVTMYPDLRVAFALDNAELGWLSSAFMLGHAIMNVPFGWLADRYDRRRVLAAGVGIWSAANLASMLADGFGSLVVSRACAGIGTAACVPIANAILCDVFPSERKARTVAVLNIGLFIGGGAGIVLGEIAGFPLAFAVIGVPGLVATWLIATVALAPSPESLTAAPAPVAELPRELASMLAKRTMRRMLLGAVAASFAAGGYLAWFADFLDTGKGFDPRDAMLILGALGLSGGLCGVMAGAALADHLFTRYRHGRLMGISIGFFAAVPCAIVAIYVDRGPVFYVASWCLMFFINWYHGPMAATVDDLSRPERASLSQAVFVFVMHLLGTASAPVLVGLLVDRVGVVDALLAPTAGVLVAGLAFACGCASASDDIAETC